MISAALSMGVTSLAGACAAACGCVCAPTAVVDGARCSVEPEKEGALNEGGLVRPAFDGVRAGAGVLGKRPGVGRSGVTGGYDIVAWLHVIYAISCGSLLCGDGAV
jgi:hypothetical protein